MENILEDLSYTGLGAEDQDDQEDYYFFKGSEYQDYYGDEFGYHSNELNYIDDEYGYDEYSDSYDDYSYNRITWSELIDQCILPTLSQATYTVYPVLGLCLLTRIVIYLSADRLPWIKPWSKPLSHATSCACGIVSLYLFFEETIAYPIMLALLSYALLCATVKMCRAWSGTTVAFTIMVYLVTCEVLVVDEKDWHRIRGAQMVLSMKIISLAFDLSSNSQLHQPNVLEFCGYVFHVGTVIFGPWIPYSEYCYSLNYKERKMEFGWLAKCVKSCVLSVVCVVMSTCLLPWFILEDEASVWSLAFRDAMSFRYSHYFVSYMSELTATLSGVGANRVGAETKWDLVVTRPLHVELPRSLVEVVVNWNLPMHNWLKTYVFKTAKPLGNMTAVLLTYAASSLLHGLNFQLAAVLLSLGFYSYVEYVTRDRLAKIFSACIRVRPCKAHCDHEHMHYDVYVRLVVVGLGTLASFHLAYLGLMFDSSPEEEKGYSLHHTLAKWSELGFSSHWVCFITYFTYLLI